jgi:SH3-like domain-containing protein
MAPDFRMIRRAAALFLCLAAAPAAADDATPHYMSIRRDEANMREGPSYDHRILWVYKHKEYPLKVVAKYDAWLRVKDVDGTVGWMHRTQLSDRRTVLFIGFTKSPLRNGTGLKAKILAYAQPGVVARLKACKLQFCEISAADVDGWVDRRNIWGVDAGEIIP